MTRNYQYGLGFPDVNAALVDEQIWRAHCYRNVLTAIERDRRDEIRAAMSGHADMAPLEERAAALAAQRDRARTELLAQRRAARARTDTTAQRATVRELGTQLREVRGQIKALRAAVAADPIVKAKLDAASERAYARVREQRATCGVYWGTYLLQESDADRARREKTAPRFRRWNWEGRVSVQLQGGLDLDDLESDTQLQILRVAPENRRWRGRPQDPAQIRRHSQACGTKPRTDDRGYARLRLRIGSDDNRAPIWAEWPLLTHRPLPPGARIKVATVTKHRKNIHDWVWQLTLTVDDSAAAARPAPAAGAVALNLGFCLRPGGDLRSGYLVGDDGREYEVLVKRRIIDALGKADAIQGVRKQNLETLRAAFSAWRATVTPPETFAERIERVYAWESTDRFRRLAYHWRGARWDGDEEGFALLEAWRYRDQHLGNYESGLRRTALLRRRESYRELAAQLAARYHTLVIDDTDLRDFQRAPLPESEDTEIAAVKRQQTVAACYSLREALVNAFTGRVAKRSAVDLTRRCHVCGVLNEWDRLTRERLHTCSGCGATWDQDPNACCNLLREHQRAAADGETARADNPAPRKPSRSDRLRAARLKRAS